MAMGSSGDVSDPHDAWRPPAPAPARPEEVAGYVDLVEVGRGGDSVVYRARQESMQRDVAIKVVDVGDPARAARFAREIQITVDLGRQHPNIVTVLGVATTASGRPAIVMDFFEGGTLHDRLRQHGTSSPEEVARIGAVLADALSFAHDRGVLHRDVKPQNVLVLPTSWVLTDFGIARLADAEHTSSVETFTYRHASPQILDGLPPSAADDIWSLGSTLYTLLDGRPPFASQDPDDDSALAYLRRARTEPHRPLLVDGAERLAPIIDRCLSKEVAARWGSAAELRDALLGLRTSAWGPDPGTARALQSAVESGPSPTPTPAPTPTPPTPAAPAPRVDPGPAPLAVSAASGLSGPVGPAGPPSQASWAADDAAHTGRIDPTGSVPGGPSSPASTLHPAADDADTSGSRRRLPLVLVGVALAIGLVLGIVGALLRGEDEVDPPAATSATASPGAVPSLTSAPSDPETFRDRPSRDLRIVFTRFDYQAGILDLAWTDPSEGQGRFVLIRIGPEGEETPLLEFPPGQTSAQEPYPLPPGRACYYLTVLLPGGEYGIDQDGRCFNNRG